MSKNYYQYFFDSTATEYTKKAENDDITHIKIELIRKYCKYSDSILEVGVANGVIGFEVSKNCKRLLGIDYSLKMVLEAEKLKQELKIKNISFKKMDTQYLELSSESFDLTYCYSTLTYVKNWKKALSEMCRVTKYNGYVIVDLIGKNNLEGKYWNNWHKKQGAWGQNLFDYANINKMFNGVGLEVVELIPLGVVKQLVYLPLVSTVINYIWNKWMLFAVVDKNISKIFPKFASRWFVVARKVNGIRKKNDK